MKYAQDIILKPIITERSMEKIADKVYTFKVAVDAGKIEIAKAVEEIFDVKVASVNTINCKGKQKILGASVGYRSDWKKAIVTLKADSKPISFFESMV